jgi:hypothetical protein
MLVIACHCLFVLKLPFRFRKAKQNQPLDPHLPILPAKVMKINVTGVFSMLKYVSKVMIDQQLGSGIGQEELK